MFSIPISNLPNIKLALKLDSYSNAYAFLHPISRSCLSISIQTQHYHSAIKCLCRAFADDQQDPASTAWNALEVEHLFFFSFWRGITLGAAFWYWSIRFMHATKQWQTLALLIWIQLRVSSILFLISNSRFKKIWDAKLSTNKTT